MQTRLFTQLLASLTLLLPLTPLQAQLLPTLGITGNPAAPRDVVSGEPATAGCSGAEPAVPCTLPGMPAQKVRQTIALQIPDFKPEDLLDQVYVLAYVGEKGSGTDNPPVAADGVLYKHIMERQVPAGTVVLEQNYQYYLAGVDSETQQARYTLDLHEVRLWPFLASLQATRRSGSAQLSELWQRQGKPARPLAVQPFGPGMGPGVQGDQQLMQADIFLSLQGEHLSLDEVLDTVYLETGCAVEPTVVAMVITSCR